MSNAPNELHYESERRLNTLAIESAILAENQRTTEKSFARLEVSQAKVEAQLSEIQSALIKINAFNDTSIHSINKLIDEKLGPIKIELAERKEEAAKLKTIIGVVSFIGSCIWIAFIAFKDYIFSKAGGSGGG